MAGGFIGGFNPLNATPTSYKGVWGLKEQLQALSAGKWSGLPTFKLYAFGRNSSGQIGDGTVVDRSSPVQVGSGLDWSYPSTSANSYASVAVKDNGTLWAWGRNNTGQVGDGTTTYRSSPVQIGALTTWSSASTGHGHSLALKKDGTLWAWGYNITGALGTGDKTSSSSPVQIGSLTTWSFVAAENRFSMAIKTDGTLWAWGGNDRGRLGINSQINKSSPTQVGALTNWQKTDSGRYHTIAVKTDGTLWAWGQGTAGQIADNISGTLAYSCRSSPIQVGSLSTWEKPMAGAYHSAAIKTDGTLWVWGDGTDGQLGIGLAVRRSSPVQVGALTDWTEISGGWRNSAAIRTNGTLWTWGNGSMGQLGNNSTTDRLSPVQVGLTTTVWYSVSAGFGHVLATIRGTTN